MQVYILTYSNNNVILKMLYNKLQNHVATSVCIPNSSSAKGKIFRSPVADTKGFPGISCCAKV